ncbi:hypothetical protein AVEN_170642-1 [Araneus ventricosus]|uniref:Uncharacterized protein n=1 Tax=Araneus ventricosus TaxID=182803 RepID=A0A4Y2GYZ5_ARAVE|nr:hypothetical protein AVEN_170642-1 [Araneus ventricosus]
MIGKGKWSTKDYEFLARWFKLRRRKEEAVSHFWSKGFRFCFRYKYPVMEHITYIDRGKRKVMTVDEFIALDVSSDSDDGLYFDDFLDEDPTVNSKDLKSSDSDSEPETVVEKVKNSSSIIEKQVHPSIAEAGQLTSSNTSQPTASNINQPTSSNKKNRYWKMSDFVEKTKY